jgi:formylglycine-generating enzyme required for sulfatase activity
MAMSEPVVIMGCDPESISKKGCCAPTADRTGQTADIVMPTRSPIGKRPAVGDTMISLPGGTFLMGTDYEHAFPLDGEGPVREVTLGAFRIERYPVTNRLFGDFIAATDYKTDAERFGWSFVFWAHVPHQRFHELVEDTVAAAPWWCKVRCATWNHPEGPGSDIESRQDHPVVHVSWNDAQAFCHWSGQRLPTEAEWEYAARGGLEQNLYPWGNKLRPDGEHRCNIWQGDFPNLDTGEDGFTGTCPVDSFPANGFGLYSVTGNSWEWCADWFNTEFHRNATRINPKGPPEGETRVMKGGSFLCHKSYCNRYRVAARSSNTPDSSTSHMSFRCAL